jgi:hypothetical protein
MAAEFPDGSPCGPLSDASGVGSGVDDIVAAITARPGVVSTAPTSVTIDGYQGTILDLHASASWTGACVDGGRRVVVIPILKPSGLDAGPWVGIGPDAPVRLILLKLTDERTMAIAIFTVGPSQASPFDQQIAPVMPVIESFVFHP